MVEHLKQLSSMAETGRHVVVIIDAAGWHTNDIAEQLCLYREAPAIFTKAKPDKASVDLA